MARGACRRSTKGSRRHSDSLTNPNIWVHREHPAQASTMASGAMIEDLDKM